MSDEYIRPTHHWKQKSQKRRRRPVLSWNKNVLIKNLILLGVAMFVGGSLIVLAGFAWVSKDLPDPNALSDRNVAQSTKIFDRSGEHLLYEIHGNENRTLIKLEDIPEVVKWATISVEDQQFYKHKGFNPVRIFKGVVFGTLFKGRAEGGSTITQQLVKNAILSDERTVIRKMKELLLSIAIEQRFSKDEILQLYLNEIPYGSTNYGIEAAAHSYFGKSVRDATLSEAATLAALPQAPTRYLNNPDELDARRDTILAMMESEGYISAEEKEAAQAEEVAIRERIENIEAPHFVFYVKEQLVETYGERLVEQGGLSVTTTLDYDLQMMAEESVRDGVTENSDRYGFENAALVAIDPKTGEILAMVGSVDYFSEEIDGAVNVTTRLRQPGSSFKPIVYTRAFEENYTPNTVVYDVETSFSTSVQDYAPKNYDGEEHGPVSLRKALQGSLNIAAVKVLYMVGVKDVLELASKMGYTTLTDPDRYGLSLVLGGGEVKLLEHVAAYGVLANEGVRHETAGILKVVSPEGEVLEEWQASEGERVLDANIARTTTNVLSDNAARAYIFGESNYLTLPSRPVAAKTGTTNDFRDSWAIGYTPQLVAGVWGGNNDNSAMVHGAGGSSVASPIWNRFMKAALADKPVESFVAPNISTTGKAILDGEIPTETVVIDSASGKLATDMTPSHLREEVVCGDFHSILFYVDKNDPLGAEPGAESNDPQFVRWEDGITAWIARTNEEAEEGAPLLTRCDVPEETDDVHVASNRPDIDIESPGKNDAIDSRSFAVEIRASAPRGIERIEYFIDDVFVKSSTSSTGTNILIPNSIKVGAHTLRAVAYDDVDNAGEDSVSISIKAEPVGSSVDIIDPRYGQTIELTAEQTYQVIVQVEEPEGLDSVTLYAGEQHGGAASDPIVVLSPTSPFVTMNWLPAGSGDYLLQAITEKADGGTDFSSFVLVRVQVSGTEEEDNQFDITGQEESDTVPEEPVPDEAGAEETTEE